MIIRFPKPTIETIFLHRAIPIALITLIFIFFSYFYIDPTLAQYFRTNSSLTDSIASKLTDLINPSFHYFLWPLLYFYFKYGAKNELWAQRFLIITIAVVFSNFAVEILKHILGRARPELLFSEHVYGFAFFAGTNPYLSFPSGHACTIGAICGVFASFYPRYSLRLAIVALALSFTRVILTAHYLGDAIGGVVLGLIAGQWVYKIMSHKKRGEKWKTLFKMKL